MSNHEDRESSSNQWLPQYEAGKSVQAMGTFHELDKKIVYT